MRTRLSLALAALCLATLTRPASGYQEMEPVEQTKEVTDGLNYLLYLPNEHDPAKTGWPVLVFLHGSGESSNNNPGTLLNALTKHSLPRVVEDAGWNWPFIVVSPQIDTGIGWASQQAQITAVLTRVQTEFGGDPNRQYLTGVSYGGSGTWNLGMAMVGSWAALMPLCAGGSNGDVTTLSGTPMFVVHGDADPDNDYADDRTRVDDMIAAATVFHEFDLPQSAEAEDSWPTSPLGQAHVFATLVGYQHDVWGATYGYVNLGTSAVEQHKTVPYEWLLEQSLDGTPFVDPRDAPVGTGGTGGLAGTGGLGGSAGASGSAGAGGTGGTSVGGAPASAGMPAVGGMGGSGGATTQAPLAMPAAQPASSGGCGCRAGSKTPASTFYGLLSLGTLLALRRRTLKAQRPSC